MNFQALLFCQDEKTVRVTTQLLNELEFSVETSTEPFAAVKKLMAQHFDAVVVDCDNEQNASLLFKGARNSQLNQSSLAVAVVEGQAGVANAFRIGANLVLTKPINVEQAKGTLRVARGLLKKGGESAKPAAAAPASPAVTAPSPASAAPSLPSAPAVKSAPVPAPPMVRPTAAKEISKPSFTAPPAKPAAAMAPAMAKKTVDSGDVLEVESGSPAAAEEILLDALEEHSPTPKLVSSGQSKPASLMAAAENLSKDTQRPITAAVLSSGGAASAPAPAKAPIAPEFEKIGDAVPQKAAAAPATSSVPPAQAPGLFAQRSSVPTFGSLDASQADKSGGPGKFVIIGVVAVALVAAAYFGYSKFSKHSSEAAAQSQTLQEPSSMSPAPATQVSAAPTPESPSASIPKPSATAAQQHATVETSVPHRPEPAKPAETEPEVVVTKVEPEPRIVKANPTKPVTAPKSKEADVEAPSMVVDASDDSAISKIVTSTPVNVPTAAPPAEMLRVSQGVTQGMLLKRVQPVYPHSALQMKIGGAVQLLAVINKAGNIASIKVLSGDPILAKAATDAVSQWKYKPYMLDGEAVDIQTQITVNFRLP